MGTSLRLIQDLCKSVSGRSSISGMFNIGRSGTNLVSSPRVSKGSARVQKLSRGFLTNRVIDCWNKLPLNVKLSDSVDSFKVNLQQFKDDNIEKGCIGHFWDVSHEVLSRIEGSGYLDNKKKHNSYLELNPFVAKKKFINLNVKR